jgi:hypothetical protein
MRRQNLCLYAEQLHQWLLQRDKLPAREHRRSLRTRGRRVHIVRQSHTHMSQQHLLGVLGRQSLSEWMLRSRHRRLPGRRPEYRVWHRGWRLYPMRRDDADLHRWHLWAIVRWREVNRRLKV